MTGFSRNTAGDFESFSASDSADIDYDSIYVGSTGTLALRNPVGDTVLFQNVPSGSFVPVRGASRVMNTGTTAGDLVGLYD